MENLENENDRSNPVHKQDINNQIIEDLEIENASSSAIYTLDINHQMIGDSENLNGSSDSFKTPNAWSLKERWKIRTNSMIITMKVLKVWKQLTKEMKWKEKKRICALIAGIILCNLVILIIAIICVSTLNKKSGMRTKYSRLI